jgi:hypothetical protein
MKTKFLNGYEEKGRIYEIEEAIPEAE